MVESAKVQLQMEKKERLPQIKVPRKSKNGIQSRSTKQNAPFNKKAKTTKKAKGDNQSIAKVKTTRSQNVNRITKHKKKDQFKDTAFA